LNDDKVLAFLTSVGSAFQRLIYNWQVAASYIWGTWSYWCTIPGAHYG